MATKELMTRIQSKIATFAEWEAVKGTFKPLRGEICIAEIPQGSSEASTAPTTLIKIGDGTNYFKDLTWMSAKAADVQNFLKVDSKGAVWTQATFEAWIKSLIEVTDIDLSAYVKAEDVKAVHAQVETNKEDIADLNAALTDTINPAIEDHGTRLGAAEGKITNLETAVGGENSGLVKSVNDINTKIGTVASDTTVVAMIADAKKAGTDAATAIENLQKEGGAIKENADAIAELQSDVEDIQGAIGTVEEGKTVVGMIGALDGKIGTVAEDTTVVKMINDLADGQVKANKEAIELLNGNDQTAGSVKYHVAQEIAKILNDNDDDIDTLNEIAAWITNDQTGAAKMNADIAGLTTKVDDLEKVDSEKNVIVTIKKNGTALDVAADRSVNIEVPTGTLASKDEVAEDDLASALANKINAAATEADLTLAEGRISTLEAVDAEKNVIVEVQLNGTKVAPNDNRVVNIELGDLASKDKIAKADLDDNLTTELNAKATTQSLTDGLALKADKSAYEQTVADLDAAEEKIAAFETRFGTAADVLIFNCGSSTVNV
jgi:hypothetical protein